MVGLIGGRPSVCGGRAPYWQPRIGDCGRQPTCQLSPFAVRGCCST